MMKLRKYFLDGLSNYVFFMPVVGVMTGILAHWTMEQFLTYAVGTALVIAFCFGAIYGRFLNLWRRKFKYE